MTRMRKVMLGVLTLVVAGWLAAPHAIGAVAEATGLRELLLGKLAERLQKRGGDPVSAAMTGLETHLGLSDDQKAAFRPLLAGLRTKMMADDGLPKAIDATVIENFRAGRLTAQEIEGVLQRGMARRTRHEAEVIDTAMAVYAQLDATQRRIVANRLRRWFEHLPTVEPKFRWSVAGSVLGLSPSQQEQMWAAAAPCIEKLRGEALAAIETFKDLPAKIEKGELTAADLHRVVDRRKQIMATHRTLVATSVHGVLSTLTDAQRDQVLQVAARFRPAHQPAK